jgi:hypothetical protein
MKSDEKSDEFFIGWQGKQPAGMRRLVFTTVVCILTMTVALAFGLARAQRAPDVAAYAWSNIQTFDGILQATPYPHLLVARPGSRGYSAYPLVGPTKFGITSEWCGDFDGRPVQFDGGLIYRNGSTLIEVVSEAPRFLGDKAEFRQPLSASVEYGQLSLVGEIVDSKCFTGSMNPGRYKPHRACAAVCLAGGIPPTLVVNVQGGSTVMVLLVGPNGEMFNEELLPHIARPVRVNGRLQRYHDLWVMHIDPGTIETL